MNSTALVAAHTVAYRNRNLGKGGPMVKIRVQGTKEDINWIEKQIGKLKDVQITESSDIYSNQGTKKYFRKYMEVENLGTRKNE